MSDGRNRAEGEKSANNAGRALRVHRPRPVASLFDLLESRILLSATLPAGATFQPAQNVANHRPTAAASGLLPFGAVQITPLTITYQDILTATKAQDVDIETISFVITNVPGSAGTLFITHDGTTNSVTAGSTVLVPTDTLTWTPSTGVSGKVNAFTVQAEDPELNLAANMSKILISTAALPEVSIATKLPIVWESKAGTNSHQGKILLKRNGNLSQPLQVTLTVGGTAAVGTNYNLTYVVGGVTQSINASPAAITFPANVGLITLTVAPIEDNVNDPILTVVLSVTPDPNAADPAYAPNPAAATASAQIIDSNPSLTITADSAGILEGAANQQAFVITRKAAPGGTLNTTTMVDLSFTGGTFSSATQLTAAAVNGTSGLDNTQTLLVTFAPGQTRKTITLTTTDNGSANGVQTIVGALTAAPGSTLAAPLTASLNVNDASPTVNIVSVNASANEMTGSPGQFLVTRTGPDTSALTVDLTNSAGSGFAVLGTTYKMFAHGLPITNAVTILPGHSSVVVNVVPIDDHINDALKATITLAANGTFYNIGATNNMTVTITNNDRAPIVAVPTVNRLAGRNSSITLSYTTLVSLMGASLGKNETAGVLQLTVTAINDGTLEYLAKGTNVPTTASTSTVVSAGDSLIWNSSSSSLNFVTAFTLGAKDGTVSATGTTNFVLFVS